MAYSSEDTIVKLKDATATQLNSSGVLIEASLVRLINYSVAQFLWVYDSTNTTQVNIHVINQYETLYLVKEKDQYLRSGTVVYGTPVALEG
tara:strand:+ start:224 stop:496 length:273 start_codon:yes stop_codon:yes gene_type:complete